MSIRGLSLRLLLAGMTTFLSVFGCLGQGGNLGSVFGSLEQEWQSLVCLQMLGARMAACGLSVAAWRRDDDLWFVFGYCA